MALELVDESPAVPNVGQTVGEVLGESQPHVPPVDAAPLGLLQRDLDSPDDGLALYAPPGTKVESGPKKRLIAATFHTAMPISA